MRLFKKLRAKFIRWRLGYTPVGLSQLVTTTGRARARTLKNRAIDPDHPLYQKEMFNEEEKKFLLDVMSTTIDMREQNILSMMEDRWEAYLEDLFSNGVIEFTNGSTVVLKKTKRP